MVRTNFQNGHRKARQGIIVLWDIVYFPLAFARNIWYFFLQLEKDKYESND
jgi:hypothetical protein